MRPLTFTVYTSAQSRQGTIVTHEWPQMIEALDLLTHDVRGTPEDTHDAEKLNAEKNGRAIVLGPVQGARSKKNVQHVEAWGIDVDSQPDEAIRGLLGVLDPFEYVAWTTHTNGALCKPEGLRLRIVLPLAQPYPATDHPTHWQRLQRLALGLNDPKTKDAGRLHFLPSTYDPNKALAWRHAGRWISVDDLPKPSKDHLENFGVGSGPSGHLENFGVLEVVNKLVSSANRAANANPMKPLLRALAAGAAFPEGERHESIVKLTWWLSGKNSRLNEEAVHALFARSIDAMQTQADPPTLDECWIAYQGALEKREDVATSIQAGEYGPYSQLELERIAQAQGTIPDKLNKRWLIGREGRWWILQSDGSYLGSHSEKDATIVMRQALRRAPVRLVRITENGESFLPFLDVASNHSTVASRVISDLAAQRTYYKPEQRTIYEATTPLRIVEPYYDERIERWLRDMAGESAEKLFDWMACLPDLRKLLCALYFDGAGGSGKTLFAHGLAKLWANGSPGDLRLALADYNEEIKRCPLLFADEALPKRVNREDVTTRLRAMLSTTARTLNRKYHEVNDLHGAVRLVLAANNESLLDTEGAHTMADIEAIAKRFMYIEVSSTAAANLEKVDSATKMGWLNEGLARHAIWLAYNREVMPASRFWVEGNLSDMHLRLTMASRWNAFVLEWCCGYLMNPQPFDRMALPYVRRGEGKLLVNVEAITRCWDMYVSADKVQPTTAMIAKALRSISRDRSQLRTGTSRVWYYEVNTEIVSSWGEHIGKGDRETIEAHLQEEETPADGEQFDSLGTLPTLGRH